MKKKFTLLLVCFISYIGLAMGQNSSVKGIVISQEDGNPIIGASVIVKGTNMGTITDIDGEFVLERIPANASLLVVSYIGMKTEEMRIQPNMRIILSQDDQVLDEVIVVAYGTAKKSSFTGSASVVGSDRIDRVQAANVTKALDGAVAGVQITSSSGAPGSGTSIRVRGLGSINASSEPLIVVDGVPHDGDLNLINQQDIESMTVLKDAAANALYGARGANGVVLITTKRGKVGKSTITADVKVGGNMRGVPEYDIMKDPATYYTTYWKGLKGLYEANNEANPAQLASSGLITDRGRGLNYNITNVASDQVVLPDGTFNPDARILYQDDWEKELFHSGIRQEYNLNMSGANESTSYYLSFGYLNDEGYIVNSGFERYSARLRMEHQFKSWLKAGGNMAYVNTTTSATAANEDQDQTAGVNIFYVSRTMAPIYPVYKRDAEGNKVYDEKGQVIYDYGDDPTRPHLGNTNALGGQYLDERKFQSDYFSGNMFAELSLPQDIKFTFRVGLENENKRSRRFYNGEYGQFTAQNGIADQHSERDLTINLQQLLTWGKTFNQHRIDILIGHETYQNNYDYLYGSKNNFAIEGSMNLGHAVSNPRTNSYATKYATEGFLGRAEYNFSDKYYFSGSYRRDASSVFHKDHRWGNFWSVGASWRIKEEEFMKDADWLDNLKYKISYGSQGNDYLLKVDGKTRNRYAYQDQYEVVNNNGQPAITQVYKGNKELKWETNYNFNTGVEFGMFQHRLYGGVEFFMRHAKDLLFNRPLAISSGSESYPDNIGDMRNIGVEFEIGADLIRTDKIKWNFAINATHYKNKILTLPEEKKESGVWVGHFKLVEGGSYYDYYIKEWAGVDPSDGAAMWYKDMYDDYGNVIGKETTKVASEAETRKVATALPKLYGGFNTFLEVHGFDLSLNFSYQLGGKGLDNTYRSLMHSGFETGYNFHNDILNAWTPENIFTDVPKLNAKASEDNSVSSRFLVSASYLSLQNISLGYTFAPKIVRKISAESLRIYLVADNVALLSARKGYDPRMNWNGESKFNYAAIRAISGGVTVRF